MPNTPSHEVFYVKEAKQEAAEARWIKVGAMWPNQDGKGYNLDLETLPVDFNGRLTARERKERKPTEE